MSKIIVKAEAQTSFKNPEKLDGIDCQDRFSDYFDSDASYKNVVKDGYMDFRFENGKLMTYTIYNADRFLTIEELDDLRDYTQGQWSDGIGEGFEQFPCTEINGEKVYISPWFYGQNITIEQHE